MAESCRYILGMRIDALNYPTAVTSIFAKALAEQPTYVCIANVHMVMEAYQNPDFQAIINNADLVTPDGIPLVWGLRRLGCKQVERVYGPGLTLRLCEIAAREGVPVGFLGGTEDILNKIEHKLVAMFPELNIVYRWSPPFRPLTAEENERVVAEVTASGAKILFIGLGCPKQERWMAAHVGKIPAVMIGVGAAFDFIAGVKPQAPPWMQSAGLEWLFRLSTEPRRLWRRYLYHNPRFICLFAQQLFGLRKFS